MTVQRRIPEDTSQNEKRYPHPWNLPNETLPHGTLGSNTIQKEYLNGNIVIYPFVESHLGSASYDVTLGEYYYAEQQPRECYNRVKIFNPYSAKDVQSVWGSVETATEYLEHNPMNPELYAGKSKLDGIESGERIILLAPGQTILAHTKEFIGGRNNITSMMKARSSFGRSFIEVCKCAGTNW